jgi:hypothetical protein
MVSGHPPSGTFVLRTGTPYLLCLVSYVALLGGHSPRRHTTLYIRWLAITTKHAFAKSCRGHSPPLEAINALRAFVRAAQPVALSKRARSYPTTLR